jgi:hypothetical protein
MAVQHKVRVEILVDRHHVAHIGACLSAFDYDDFEVRPVLAECGHSGRWNLSPAFASIGERVLVGFVVDREPAKELIASGFGILSNRLISIRCSDHAAPLAA